MHATHYHTGELLYLENFFNFKGWSTESCIMHNLMHKKSEPIRILYFFPYHEIKDSDSADFLMLYTLCVMQRSVTSALSLGSHM